MFFMRIAQLFLFEKMWFSMVGSCGVVRFFRVVTVFQCVFIVLSDRIVENVVCADGKTSDELDDFVTFS